MKKPQKPPLHDLLRSLRESAGLSRGALADLAGIDRPYYGRLEAGKVLSPSWPVVCAVADVLGVSLDSLRK
jgi:transcriptional regulator with XRE-family HTH domain